MYAPLEKPYVLSIAGLDPTAGAGILADVKTFTATGSYGFAVATCLTAQTEDTCEHVQWFSVKEITTQLKPLLENYPIAVTKLGAMKDLVMTEALIDFVLEYNPDMKFVLDPILSTSSGKEFMKLNADIKELLSKVYLLTPNYPEIQMLTENQNALEAAMVLSMHTNVYLKGGHSNEEILVDRLFVEGVMTEFPKQRNAIAKKHGSGCVLSSSIASFLAQGKSLAEASEEAAKYMCGFFSSTETKLGIHQ
ncbi:hydroxymethylpyrimidine/phosphomethylpyrimidine kinase [Cytophaga hutchinsonii]|uniref:hydroxymethylpyrimidine kinase n=1 Tax=Cytophaga hutchinsonii (strain ATCC 33406 / DSM 1761 / CIP 103989 / NBRC 15051 / NCIMB 9469 / D465) TaxID=269798 RepID=A0A6N4SMN3_CYTH3|nr:hydroxymethylpyrimidine/phosphomethylpyrimidine kinase [Cytophaga hutchinsonii]ABG57533.1 phosphomethylpyrimidine kinase [Cytophaga hutchinsonii ATCC 33406]SFW99370.1 hydroxymethylpyrimidine/phosphomethylpyrimidine kinase [Cytophaga hutchinsonii ATCC 33406]